MSRPRHHLLLAFCLCLSSLIVSCSNDPYFRSAPTYIAYKDAPASALNRAWISGTSIRSLILMKHRGLTHPQTTNQRIAVAEREINRAQKQAKQSDTLAIANYLAATEALWPVVRAHPNPQQQNYWGPDKRIIIAHQLYAHAVGQSVELLIEHGRIHPGEEKISLTGHKLSINSSAPHHLTPSYFDSFHPIDTHRFGNVGEHHYRTIGLGAAAIGHRNPSPERKIANPLMPPHGVNIPVNAIIDFPRPGEARLTMSNLLKTDRTRITGNTRPLAANYSAAIAANMDDQSSLLGLAIALNPKKYGQHTGLFAIGPFDPDKIPVIFIHGLISQPSTWTTPSNYLLADRTIRENYQFFYYFYPTGATPLISGVKLRTELLNFYNSHDPQAQKNLRRTVLIGHSMGGLLSSVQSRNFDQALWQKIFQTSPSDRSTPQATATHQKTSDPKSIRAQVAPLFNPPSLPSVERTIFVATPHRGSELAGNWIGRIGSSLIRIPQSILTLQLNVTAQEMTAFGRNLINSSGPANSISRLKPNSQSLELLNAQPFNPRVRYHSIIGDRGRNNSPDSSDGVVPYWSSHLEGASSEAIVPGYHEAHRTKEAHQEMARILHLHLKETKN